MTQSTSYFSKCEWRGFWITMLVSFSVYLFTLAPNVTLEDSGEFLTAAYHWGVPHPPGYPFWTISANIFERIIPFGNAAWKVNLMSAFYGALASAMLCLLTCKMVSRLWTLERFADFEIKNLSRESIIVVSGIVSGLVFAFIDTMWSQAVIAEVYTLNGFFFTSLCFFVLRWYDAPHQSRWCYLLALTFGLSITNHQTLLVAAPAFLFALYFPNRSLYRDTAFLASLACGIFAWQSDLWFLWIFCAFYFLHFAYLVVTDSSAWNLRTVLSICISMTVVCGAITILAESRERPIWIFLGAVFFLTTAAISIYCLASSNMALKSVKPFILSFVMFAMGSSLYLYMPLSSVTNPPMNWGYTRTAEGFRHQITRGQYERIQLKRDPKVLMGQFSLFFKDLKENFSLPLLLMGVLPLVFFTEFSRREKFYLFFTGLCFFFMGPVLVFLMNPKFDEQSMFVNRVFYSLAHGVYSMWIGMACVIILYWAKQTRERLPLVGFVGVMAIASVLGHKFGLPLGENGAWLAGAGVFFLALSVLLNEGGLPTLGLGLICALPVIPLKMNWADSEMRGHDFGVQYGHDMLVHLDRDAVVYGGTDPGRFVPTAMIFVESFQPKKWRIDPEFDRRDLYLITQNALADQTYMNYIRGHYDVNREKMDRWYHKFLGRDELYPKEPLILPNEVEFNEVFSKVVQEGANNPRSGVTYQKDASGKVRASVQGVEGVFAINGGMAKWIFEKNKDKHTFYVEESYPLQWMYPYLEPAGLIMKLNKEPSDKLNAEAVSRDMAYWDALVKKLLANPKFLRDSVARKSYSKLRSSLGGVYVFRSMMPEAEKSLKEAIALYPASSEARSRLTEILATQRRFDEAMQNCEEWLNLDPFNSAPQEIRSRVQGFQSLIEREIELASLYPTSKNDPNFIFQYANVLKDSNKWPELDRVIDEFLGNKVAQIGHWQTAIQLYAQANRPDRVETLLLKLTRLEPKNAVAWMNLAVIQSSTFKTEPACESLKKAIALDSNFVQMVRTDARFNNVRNSDSFQKVFEAKAEKK